MKENNGFVRCAIENLNTGFYNPQETAEVIKERIQIAEQNRVKVLVFPELCLTGCSCQDLFFTPDLMDETLECLLDIANSTYGTEVISIIGTPIRLSGTVLYNCAVVIQNGQIRGIVPKQNLSEEEKRWFSPYSSNNETHHIHYGEEKIPFGNITFLSSLGFKLGIEIGDDLNAVIPPSSYMALEGATIIANPSASYELIGTDNYRQEMIKTQSARTICAYLYTSAGICESSGEKVFGGSGYIFENGKKLATFERFSENSQSIFVDIDVEMLKNKRASNSIFRDNSNGIPTFNSETILIYQENDFSSFETLCTRQINPTPFIPDEAEADNVYREIFSIQSTALARRLSSIGCSKVTLGVSGGLDSTLALLVCCEAFKKLQLPYSGPKSEIIGITMPGFGTTNRTHDNATELCKELGIPLSEISVKDVSLQTFIDIGHDPDIHDVTYENVQARARTSILMNLANKNNAIVVGTGDLSEAALGWCTFNGDHMSMYNVNCSIPKTLIRPLIRWYANEHFSDNDKVKNILFDIIDTPISPELLPTDGTKVVQKTENSVGPYEVIDFFIYHFVGNKFSREKILYMANKAFDGKYTKEVLEEYYDKFSRRFFNNQFKRNCVPDGPKVSSISLSPKDWRMPSDTKYHKF